MNRVSTVIRVTIHRPLYAFVLMLAIALLAWPALTAQAQSDNTAPDDSATGAVVSDEAVIASAQQSAADGYVLTALEQYYSLVSTADSAWEAAQRLYERGNLLVTRGLLEAAIDDFTDALIQVDEAELQLTSVTSDSDNGDGTTPPDDTTPPDGTTAAEPSTGGAYSFRDLRTLRSRILIDRATASTNLGLFDQADADIAAAVALGDEATTTALLTLQARRAYYSQDLEGAVIIVEQALAREPNLSQVVTLAAQIAYSDGRPDDGFALLAGIVDDPAQSNQARADAHNMRGLMYQADSDPRMSILDFDAAIAAAPQWAVPRVNRAIVLRQDGNTETALEEISSTINLDEKYRDAYLIRAAIYVELGNNSPQTDQHRALYNRALADVEQYIALVGPENLAPQIRELYLGLQVMIETSAPTPAP